MARNNPDQPRLVGVETEYGLRVRPKGGSSRPANSDVFHRLLSHVRRKVPLAASIASPNQQPYAWFTANGGAVRFEVLPVLGAVVANSGLVEGATPECGSARQLLLYQRAQDALLSQAAAATSGPDCDVVLLKNNSDGHGSCFSCHENYDAEIASSTGFKLWRLGLIVIMLPTAIAVEVLASFVLILTAVLYFPAWLAGRWKEQFVHWWERGTLALISLVITPALWIPTLYFRLLAFRRQRQGLLAFLVSRQVFAGAGLVQQDGRFVISARAQVVGSLVSAASESSRPVFLFGHILKATSFLALGDTSRYRALFQPRQRLQIAVGDSNMAQTAEYLKIGTTRLVLAAIEAGELKSFPRLKRPLRSLRQFSRDLDLKATAALTDGRRLTMVEIQRLYWTACRRYVDRCETADSDAEEILSLWAQTLHDLEQDPLRLFGRVDWITKRMLLEAGEALPVDARRKLDAQYHELTPQGGYIQLEAAGAAPTIVEPEDVLLAIQQPPAGTRAAARGRLIRNSNSPYEGNLQAGWSHVLRWRGETREMIDLAADGSDGADPKQETACPPGD